MILMTNAKDWIDKRTDGVVAKAFNFSYCIRIGMCKKIPVCSIVMRECTRRVGLQQKCTNARSELSMVEITPPSRMEVLRPPSFTCMHTCVSCMHVNTFMNCALRIAAAVARAMPCRDRGERESVDVGRQVVPEYHRLLSGLQALTPVR